MDYNPHQHLPLYAAADLHSLGNHNPQLLIDPNERPEISTTDSITKFLRASLAAGQNEIFGMIGTVGSWLPGAAPYEAEKLEDRLLMIDSNLADYYIEHKDAVDIVGFVASSFLPGMGGVKVLNATQLALHSAIKSGKIGSTMGRAVGLLTPNQPALVQKAIKEITANDQPFKLLKGNTLKALGAGFGKNALDAAAFETAVAATMYNSPVLEDQDFSDLFWNGVTFATVGGVVGGLFSGAAAVGAIKRGAKAEAEKLAPWKKLIEPRTQLTPAEKFQFYLEQKTSLPAVPAKTGDTAFDDFVHNASLARERTIRDLDLRLLESSNQLAKGDLDLGKALFHATKDAKLDEGINLFGQAVEAGRLAKPLELEKEFKSLVKKTSGGLAGTPDELERMGNIAVRYMHITGETAGEVSEYAPKVQRLADTVNPKKGERVRVDGNKVIAGNFREEFHPNKSWDIFEATPLQAEARRLWAMSSAPLKSGAILDYSDIPMLEKALREQTPNAKIKLLDGSIIDSPGGASLLDFIKEAKEVVATQWLDKGISKLSQDEIASIVNVNPSVLRGLKSANPDTYFADLFAAKKYTQQLVDSGARLENQGLVDITNLPSVMKVAYDTTPVIAEDGNKITGMLIVQHKQRMYQDSVDRVVAATLPPKHLAVLPDLTVEHALRANSVDAPGRGFFSTSNSDYATSGNVFEFIGTLANKMKLTMEDAFKDRTSHVITALGRNEKAAVEWSVLQQKVRNMPEHYVVDPSGEKRLLLKKDVEFEAKVLQYEKAGKDISKLQPPAIDPNIPREILIQHDETYNMLLAHIEEDGRRTAAHAGLSATQGVESIRTSGSGVFYPPAPNPRDYKYFTFVEDTSIIGAGRKRMIYAQSEQALNDLIASVNKGKPDHWRVYTRKESEEYFKRSGTFEFEQTMDDIDFDRQLKRLGASASEFVPTNPQKIVDDWLNWNVEKERGLVTTMLAAKYQHVFDTLKHMGNQYTNLATSVKGSARSLVKFAEATVDNPYADYIRTALGLPRNAPFESWWFTPQRKFEGAISRMYETVSNVFKDSSLGSGEALEKINANLREAGYKGLNYDESIALWTNNNAPRGIVTSVARKANALMATLTLRLDFMNSAVNTISANILYYPEIQRAYKALKELDPKLVEHATISVPGSGGDRILSPIKLHGNAIKNYFRLIREPNDPLIPMYKEYGFMTSISDQYRHIIDDITFTGQETAKELLEKEKLIHRWREKLQDWVQVGEKVTGNKFAEDFNRFLAADTARQIFEPAVAKGLISESEMWANMSTFVRRTQGTYDAFMRPAAFQGPVGQFIGLFQTYQFNLMQQLFRHVQDGGTKNAMMLLGLQGTIWGMNGLPGFNFVNTHLIGTASGNNESRDIFSTLYSGPSVEAAEWLMYGAGANLLGLISDDLKTSMYTRGDINPRHLTILPTSLDEIPAVGAAIKIFSGIKQSYKTMGAGGDTWQTFLTGLEHSSINRPLAGLAQVLQATTNPALQSYSTTRQGNMIASNDLLSLANLSRLAGGRPFDEAVIRDLEFRSQVYNAHMDKKKQQLGRAIKSAAMAGQDVSEEEVRQFAQSWVGMGGDIMKFNQFMLEQMTNANETTAMRLQESLKSPVLQRLQRQMGGAESPTENLF